MKSKNDPLTFSSVATVLRPAGDAQHATATTRPGLRPSVLPVASLALAIYSIIPMPRGRAGDLDGEIVYYTDRETAYNIMDIDR